VHPGDYLLVALLAVVAGLIGLLHAVEGRIGGSPAAGTAGPAARGARTGPGSAAEPPTPLPGYQVLEVSIGPDSPAVGQALGALSWPSGWIPVSALHERSLQEADPGLTLAPGDRVNLLAPAPERPSSPQPSGQRDRPGAGGAGRPR
jgi:hypothetical protein